MDHTQAVIADVLGKHKTTISRELKRKMRMRGYRPKQVQYKTLEHRSHMRALISRETWTLICEKIRLDWSPEQVSGRLRMERDIHVSRELIYQYILADKRTGGDLYHHLRLQMQRRKRYGSYERRGKLLNRVSIKERPAIVAECKQVGDWEVDTIIGKRHQQAFVTLTERKTRMAMLCKVDQRTADQVGPAVIDLLQSISHQVHTITADNGKEFAEHQ